MKNTIINLVFSILTFAVLLTGIEIVLRCTHLFNARMAVAMPDPLLGWRFIPNGKYWNNSENDHPVSGTYNRFGWRDREWSVEKPKDTYRIAVLGDSFVEAAQVEMEKNFLRLTEDILNKKLKNKVELMNFGRSGATQSEEYIVLQKDVPQFHPDMVILFFAPVNDIEDISIETAPDKLRPFYNLMNGHLILNTDFVHTRDYKIKSFINWFKSHSILISFLCERYNHYAQVKNMIKARQNSPGKLEPYFSLCTENPDPRYVENYRLNKELIKAIAAYCKKNEMKFMLAVIDINSYLFENERKYKSIDSSFNSFFFEDDLKHFSESMKVDYLGLQRIFQKSYESNHVPLHWGHWNYEGHKVVSDALVNKLKALHEEYWPDK
ncbi:MAG: SGNH/GDSL hydrolase family protein [Candidatus Aureabacteria bacterium]|nr:SGNH/GDSL hydrolase family protein [Candidatus Auribacterota bacterium]